MNGAREPIKFTLISESGLKRSKERVIEGLAKRVEDKFVQTKSEDLRR